MRTEGGEAGNEGGVGFSHSPPAVGVATWCVTRKEVLPGICATIQKRGHRPALFPPSNPAHPQSPSPRLRLNHPIYLQLRSSKKVQSSETNGPHARPSIPEQCISNIPSHPATLDSIMPKSLTREYQVLFSVHHVQNARCLLLQSRACLLGCPWIGTGRCTVIDYRRNNRCRV